MKSHQNWDAWKAVPGKDRGQLSTKADVAHAMSRACLREAENGAENGGNKA